MISESDFILKKCKAMIRRHEGLRLFAYEDSVGVLTVGYGHAFLGPEAAKVRKGQSFTLPEIEGFFEKDFQIALRDYGKLAIANLDEVRKCVIIDMLFNLGLPRFLGFEKMLSHLKNRDYAGAGKEMLNSKWARQVKGRADELAAMMRTGKWQK